MNIPRVKKSYTQDLIDTVCETYISAIKGLTIADINMYKAGYEKAIDDTVKTIKEEYAFTILEEEKIDKIAEQLKGAKQNEDSDQKEV